MSSKRKETSKATVHDDVAEEEQQQETYETSSSSSSSSSGGDISVKRFRAEERDADFDADFFEGRGEGDGVVEGVDYDEILRLVEAAPDVQKLDEQQLRTLVTRLNKAIDKNVQLRTKYPDEPEKFETSELDLDEAIRALLPVATEPQLYPSFVASGALSPLLGLLTHENVDIGTEVLGLLSELLESDVLNESEENDEKSVEAAWRIVDEIFECKGFVSMIKFIEKLDEDVDTQAQSVYDVLALIESLVESRLEVAKRLVQQCPLIEYLLKRIAKPPAESAVTFPTNRLYASEILSLLLAAAPAEGQAKLAARGGMKVLVDLIAPYRKAPPTSAHEEEYLSNLFGAVSAGLLGSSELQKAFTDAGGLELMVMILRKHTDLMPAALKAIESTLENNVAMCERFVDMQGLKTLFGLFMTKLKSSLADYTDVVEERTLASMLHLFLHLTDVRYYRLLAKFTENNFEKVERLVDLFEKYLLQIERSEQTYKRTHPTASDVADPEATYLRKLDHGYFVLQRIAAVVAFVATAGETALRERVVELLAQRDASLDDLRNVMEDQIRFMATEREQDKTLQAVLKALVDKLQS